MDMTQRPLTGYQKTSWDDKGNLAYIGRYRFDRDKNGKVVETLVEFEEWMVIDGLNQRVSHWKKDEA